MNEDKMELEKAIEKVNKIRLNFYDKQYKKSYTDDELTDMCDSLSTILQYIQYDSIPKQKIEDKVKEVNNKILKLDKENKYLTIDEIVLNKVKEFLQQLLEGKI